MNKKTGNKVIEQIKKEAIREVAKNEAVREQAKDEAIDVDLKQQLSEHFKLSEFTQSGIARRHKIKNVPGPREVERLRFLCVKSLEPMRRRFGAIRITSGFRCKKLTPWWEGRPRRSMCWARQPTSTPAVANCQKRCLVSQSKTSPLTN